MASLHCLVFGLFFLLQDDLLLALVDALFEPQKTPERRRCRRAGDGAAGVSAADVPRTPVESPTPPSASCSARISSRGPLHVISIGLVNP